MARDDDQERPKGIRARMGRAILGVPFMRRWYARRLLKMLDKAKAKGRELPPDLAQLQANLSRMPKGRRFEALESALEAGSGGEQALSREMRRAASRQGRQSGRGGARQRPGQPVYPVRPKRPKPR